MDGHAVVCPSTGASVLISDVTDLIFQAGLIVQLVLLILLASSVGSWAIILSKWRELRNARQDSEAFLEVYHRESLGASVEAARHLGGSPLSMVFLSACNEMSRVTQGQDEVDLSTLETGQRRSLRKAILWTADRERWRLERGLPFLGTVGSSAPFVGLFGTVVGIITTFQSIGRAGSASLAVVGPGMAEALIATGVGLLAAIPATIAYNAFATRLDGLESALDLFAQELIEDLGLVTPEASKPELLEDF
ncbi:MAG: MotA/TolQ/ExbB proton channel family protein [Myxococcota bacterium]|nr:MotA/TolQ/ExbB proton channel family protein [Myxococcota bacterium]